MNVYDPRQERTLVAVAACVVEGWRVVSSRKPAPRDEARRQAEAFRNRAFLQGDLPEFEAATRMLWQVEDRRVEADPDPLPWQWKAGGLATVTVAVLLWWQTILLWGAFLLALAVAVLGLVGWFALRPGRPRPAAPLLDVAPPQMTPAQRRAVLEPALPPWAKAIAAATPGRVYAEAITAGDVDLPAITDRPGGRRIVVDLPGGITADRVDLERVAGAVGVSPRQIRRHPAPHPGVLVLDVAANDPAMLPAAPWPGLRGSTDFGEPIMLGHSELGDEVHVQLAGRRVLVGGASGSGKTWTLRLLALHAAGDPRTRLDVVDLKADGDLDALAAVAGTFIDAPDERVVKLLDGVIADMETRYAWRRQHPGVDVGPELGWRVLVIDEVHRLWTVEGAQRRVEDIARRGRAAGVGILAGTQCPDKRSLPSAISGQFDVRIAGRLATDWAEGLILGEYKVGCAGLGTGEVYLSDQGPARFVRVAGVDTAAAGDYCQRAAGWRPGQAMPMLGGTTADLDDVEPTLLDVVAAVWPDDRTGLAWDELARLLDLPRDEVRAELRTHGVASRKVRVPGIGPVNGVRHADLTRALDRNTGRNTPGT